MPPYLPGLAPLRHDISALYGCDLDMPGIHVGSLCVVWWLSIAIALLCCCCCGCCWLLVAARRRRRKRQAKPEPPPSLVEKISSGALFRKTSTYAAVIVEDATSLIPEAPDDFDADLNLERHGLPTSDTAPRRMAMGSSKFDDVEDLNLERHSLPTIDTTVRV